MCAVYTDVPTCLRGSSSVHSCVSEIMHACVCHGLFVCWLEFTYNCLWFDSGLCFVRVLFFTPLFLVYYVCIIAFDMIVLCEAMLICFFSFFYQYTMYIL